MTRPYRIFSLLIMMLVFVTACEEAEPTQESAFNPTVTLLPPIITETPRFTATLAPSETPTPSQTFTPTDTPTATVPTDTPTPSPTAPQIGSVASNQNVNIREEPSFNATVLTRVEPGTEMEIHGSNEDQDWIRVRFIDVDGTLVDGWITVTLFNLGDYIPPTIGPTPTATSTPDPDATADAALEESTLVPTLDGGLVPGPNLSDENVRANCIQTDDPVPSINADKTVSVWFSWFVARPELMSDHLENAEYEILLNGRLLEYEPYQTEMSRESDGNWYTFWYIPVETLDPGRYEVTYRVTWDSVVNDGYDDFGPGTANEFEEGNCVFTVDE